MKKILYYNTYMLSIKDSFFLLSFIFFCIFIIAKIYTEYRVKSDKKESKKNLIKNYIGLTLLIFGLLKLYNLDKFVTIFSKYDLISKNINLYGYLYPFIEIILGICLLNSVNILDNLRLTIILMIISILSVMVSILNGEKLRCGCLGSFFYIPLSYTTLAENTMMLLMSYNYLN